MLLGFSICFWDFLYVPMFFYMFLGFATCFIVFRNVVVGLVVVGGGSGGGWWWLVVVGCG